MMLGITSDARHHVRPAKIGTPPMFDQSRWPGPSDPAISGDRAFPGVSLRLFQVLDVHLVDRIPFIKPIERRDLYFA